MSPSSARNENNPAARARLALPVQAHQPLRVRQRARGHVAAVFCHRRVLHVSGWPRPEDAAVRLARRRRDGRLDGDERDRRLGVGATALARDPRVARGGPHALCIDSAPDDAGDFGDRALLHRLHLVVGMARVRDRSARRPPAALRRVDPGHRRRRRHAGVPDRGPLRTLTGRHGLWVRRRSIRCGSSADSSCRCRCFPGGCAPSPGFSHRRGECGQSASRRLVGHRCPMH